MSTSISPTTKPRRGGEILLTLVSVLAFIFIFPRAIIRWLGVESPWTPYFYLYGLGTITFLIGLRIIWVARSCQLGRGRDTFWFGVLWFGLFFFMVVHALWIWLALTMPFKGGI